MGLMEGFSHGLSVWTNLKYCSYANVSEFDSEYRLKSFQIFNRGFSVVIGSVLNYIANS